MSYNYLYPQVVREEKMNRPSQPCNTDPQYGFTACVKKTLSDRVGCVLPWDKTTKGKLITSLVYIWAVVN